MHWQIQDFRDKDTIIFVIIFAKNYMKMKKIEQGRAY